MYRQSNYETYGNYDNLNSGTQQENFQQNSAPAQPQAPRNYEQELLSLENVHVVSNGNHKQNLLNSHPNVLVYIHADWCGPCKQVKPVLVEIMKNNPNVVLLMEDVEQQITTGVRGVPFFAYYKNNSVVLNKTGIHEIQNQFNEFFS